MYLNKVIICIAVRLVCVGIIILAQLVPSPLHASDRNEVSLEGAHKIREIGTNLVEITLPETGQKIYKRTSDAPVTPLRDDVPELTIDVDSIDYEYFSDRYTFWQEVHLWHPYEMIVTDTDQDGMTELLGWRTYTSGAAPPGEASWYDMLYEIDEQEIFQPAHSYPDTTSIPWWAGDLDNDGNMEMITTQNILWQHLNAWGRVIQNYEAPAPDSFATKHNFDFNITHLTQPNHINVLNLDGDQSLDMLYYLGGGVANVETCPDATHIAEYDFDQNTFVEKFCFMQPAFYTSHYAIGDWDLDGKTEFATGGLDGELYILEASGDDTYDLIWEDTLDTYNAYMSTTTNDMNWNGKPELWIGGDRAAAGVGTTMTSIFCFEANGDNSYEMMYKILIPDIFSFYSYGVKNTDINNDGTDELLIWVDDHVFILNGSGSMPTEILYAMRNPYRDDPPYDLFMSVNSEDLDGDNYPELLVSLATGLTKYDHKSYTRLYRPSGPLLSVAPVELPETFQLIKAYPNPFNCEVKVSWEGFSEPVEMIEIIDINGHVLLSEQITSSSTRNTGTYNWNGKSSDGKEVNSGVYFTRLVGRKIQKTIKITLLK